MLIRHGNKDVQLTPQEKVKYAYMINWNDLKIGADKEPVKDLNCDTAIDALNAQIGQAIAKGIKFDKKDFKEYFHVDKPPP